MYYVDPIFCTLSYDIFCIHSTHKTVYTHTRFSQLSLSFGRLACHTRDKRQACRMWPLNVQCTVYNNEHVTCMPTRMLYSHCSRNEMRGNKRKLWDGENARKNLLTKEEERERERIAQCTILLRQCTHITLAISHLVNGECVLERVGFKAFFFLKHAQCSMLNAQSTISVWISYRERK